MVDALAADPLALPDLVVVIVATDAVFAATPVTVTRPAAPIETMPLAVAVPAQVYAPSQLLI